MGFSKFEDEPNKLLSAELAEANATEIQKKLINKKDKTICIGKFFVDDMMA